ncbi:MAG: hypothetical protein O7D30_10525 [Rickettsia endosymbiont of Ixodes persulcatus]|nr:hypothetical protein [Rickettsia endosymbiont of Ixodes persulcatus]
MILSIITACHNLFIIIYNIYISIVCTYLLWSSYTLEIKQKLQKRVLNKIFINAVKGKWSRFSILGNWGVKGYLSDNYLAKQ